MSYQIGSLILPIIRILIPLIRKLLRRRLEREEKIKEQKRMVAKRNRLTKFIQIMGQYLKVL